MIINDWKVKNVSVYNREDTYLKLLTQREHTVSELADKLFVSEPTVRRDIVVLKEKELVTCRRGLVKLKTKFPNQRIPLNVRDTEHISEKKKIAIKASCFVKDGDVVMLDASTTASFILPFIAKHGKILVVTNGAKTALEAASYGIKTICTGGEITTESYSFVGCDAEKMLLGYNADVAFFSCRGLFGGELATDNSIWENAIRKIMIKNSVKKFLLCDSSKFGHKYLNTLCTADDVDEIITE